MECNVYMVKVEPRAKGLSADAHGDLGRHRPYRQPQQAKSGLRTKSSRRDPDCPGSLGIAISEALEDAVTHADTKYSLGSVLNHVCLHQSVIGQEAIRQMEMAGEEPDVLFACAGGGSNFAGLTFPFLHKKITEKKKYRVVAVEPAALRLDDPRVNCVMTLATPPKPRRC